MRLAVVLLLACCMLSFGSEPQLWPEQPQSPDAVNHVFEALAGSAALALGAGCAVLVGEAAFKAAYDPNETGFLNNIDAAFTGIVTGGVVGLTLPMWSGTAVHEAGNALGSDGILGGAIAGAYIGALAGVGVGWLGYRLSERPYQSGYEPAIRIPAFTLGALLIPVGAIVGHDRVYAEGGSVARFHGRMGLPAVDLEWVVREDNTAECGVRVQLASVKL
jgi:hypothetical protein